MGLFKRSGSSNSSNSSNSSSTSEGDLHNPQFRVEYKDSDGFVSETAYTAESAETKADIAKENGATNVTIEDVKQR